jgi:hypothetical protein
MVACESAADTTAETLRLLGLTEQAQELEAAKAKPSGQAAAPGERSAPQVPGLARALVNDLDCAVVAMRYPVQDEFAIAFGDAFYEHLLSRRQPVEVAVARALAQAAGPVIPIPQQPAPRQRPADVHRLKQQPHPSLPTDPDASAYCHANSIPRQTGYGNGI